MPTGFYIWLVVFIIIVIGTITKPLWNKPVQPKKNSINESNAAKIHQLKQEIKPIIIPERREKTKEELYKKNNNSVEIRADYFRQLCVNTNSDEIYFKYLDSESSHPDLVRLPKQILEELEEKNKPQKMFNENLSRVCALNNKGIALEKDGNIDEAISTYEKGILIPYKAHHSYDRLLVLYRKRKDYENEKRVCLAAIDRFPEDSKYKERLSKIESKINKAFQS